MIKGLIHQDMVILNVYAPENRTIQYVKPKLTKLIGEIEKCTITGKDFNTLLSVVDRVTRQSTNSI